MDRDDMVFFYNKCLHYLKFITDMSWNNAWMLNSFETFQNKCSESSLQLAIAKQTEDGLLEWRKKLFDAYTVFKNDMDKNGHGPDAAYILCQTISDNFRVCKNVVREMVRILKPEKREYQIWYSPQERIDFLRDIGYHQRVQMTTLLGELQKLCH